MSRRKRYPYGNLREALLEAAYSEAYYGRLRKSRDSSQQAVESAQRAEAEGTAAMRLATAAVREAEAGNWGQARQSAEAALAMAPGRDVKVLAALALARPGARARAQEVASELARSAARRTTHNHAAFSCSNGCFE